MIHGEVVGEIWATVKVASLTGLKLLVVRPAGDVLLGKTARRPAADIVAADLVGAGVGERVIVALGKAARLALGAGENVAIEAAIVGIVDDLHLRDEPTSPPDERDAEPSAAATPKGPRRARGKKAAESGAEKTPPTATVDDDDGFAPTAEVGSATSAEVSSAAATAEAKAPLPEKGLRKVAASRRPEPDPETGDLFAALDEQATAATEATEASAAVEKKPRRPKRAKAAETASGAAAETVEARGIEYEDEGVGPSFGDLDAIWDGPEGPAKDLEGA